MIETSYGLYDTETGLIVEECKISRAVENAIAAVKREIPEEARTVEVMNYVMKRMRERIRRKKIIL